jgi:hypothetical protein
MKIFFLKPVALVSTMLFTLVSFAQTNTPVKVEIKKEGEGYVLYRGGKPYFIKGAGGTNYMDRLAKYGGNSIRTWNTSNGPKVLGDAERLGLTVTMGLGMGIERQGFNYDDTAAVAKQLARVRAEVVKYKDYPALMAWGIGNELNLNYKNPKVWDAVNAVAKMIHEVDPNHLATTMLAGINQREIDFIKARCPDLDLISVQVYGGLASVPAKLKSTGWNKAYMVTEWGPTGHWEGPQTPWKASVEETSSEKAVVFRNRYEASVIKDKTCLGSYVFLWGQKQERTPTWYGLFTEAGEENEVVDVMEYLWSGKWPSNRAPHLEAFTIDGKKVLDFIYLQPGKTYPVNVAVTDPDKDMLITRWELLPESTDLKVGGDRESRPQPIPGMVSSSSTDKATLTVPDKEGAYRLFLYVTDGNNNVATANIPFFVKN